MFEVISQFTTVYNFTCPKFTLLAELVIPKRIAYLERRKDLRDLVSRSIVRSFPRMGFDFAPVNTVGDLKLVLLETNPRTDLLIVGLTNPGFNAEINSLGKIIKRFGQSPLPEVVFHTPDDPKIPDFDYFVVRRQIDPIVDILAAVAQTFKIRFDNGLQ